MSYDVRIFKLISGEEVLAKVEELDGGVRWLLTDPRMLGMNPQTGQPNMMPFMMLNQDRPVTIDRSAVIAISASVPPEMEKKYVSDTSGILIP